MTLAPEQIAAIEAGLLPAISVSGRPQRMDLARRMGDYHVPGLSVAVVEGGELAWAGAYGAADRESGRPVTNSTLFQAGSISKLVTAVAVLRLVDRGILDLAEPVNTYLSSWKLPESEGSRERPVTIRCLLSHRGGTSVETYSNGYARHGAVPSLLQVLDGKPPAATSAVRVVRSVGDVYHYSSGGYAILQQVLADLSERPFASFMRELVLDPSGMTESTFAQPLPQQLWENAASGHFADGQPVPGAWHVMPEQASSGLWTTAGDLCRFAIALQRSLRGEHAALLSQSCARQLVTRLGHAPVSLGAFLSGEGASLRFAHDGSSTGFRARFVCYAEGGRAAVAMANGEAGDRLCGEVINAVADVCGWPGYLVSREEVDLDPGLAARYAGNYEVMPGVVFSVRERHGALYIEALGFGRGRLHAASPRDFFVGELPAEVTFITTQFGGYVSGAELRFRGNKYHARRVG